MTPYDILQMAVAEAPCLYAEMLHAENHPEVGGGWILASGETVTTIRDRGCEDRRGRQHPECVLAALSSDRVRGALAEILCLCYPPRGAQAHSYNCGAAVNAEKLAVAFRPVATPGVP